MGDNTIRGISGGEKKRVTIAEGLLTNARVLLLDEISTGLDSSVTFDIIKSLHQRCKNENISVVIALLQPTPEVYKLFDDVILMRDGTIIYHGARSHVPDYLTSIGFKLPKFSPVSHESNILYEGIANQVSEDSKKHKESDDIDVADFLSEVLFKPFKYANISGQGLIKNFNIL